VPYIPLNFNSREIVMSVPYGLSEFDEKLWDWAIKCPLFKCGDVLLDPDVDMEFTVLDDSEAHGAPCIRTKDGDELCKTLNYHGDVVKAIQELRSRLIKRSNNIEGI